MSTLQVHVDKPVTQASTDIRPIHTTLEPRFLRSDYVPTAAERSQLKKVLEGGEEQVKRYEEEIELLPHRLDELEAAKNTVEATNTQCRDALSTRRRTPVEIWEMVFEVLCLSLHEYSFCVSYDSSKECPAMLVSQVCSLWRIIANGMPGIWSSLDVDLDWPYNIEIPLELYLSNSKGCSLKIRIEESTSLLWLMIVARSYRR
ncbi:hypothetical protein L218DRAFT_298803 [Marasmius fiardii PR-910]|nr:hypothetical protein L218DRAFT_298803 [Marasmius fiardii PR-910]